MPVDKKQYRPEIDGLRALAVLGAVVFHMANVFDIPQWLQGAFTGGYLGVDVFFVISGYLISCIILRELSEGTFSIAGFYARRLRRIGPALFLVVFASVPFAYLLLDAGELKNFGESLLGISALASNYTFFKETGYFAAPAEHMPMLHTWSLAVEEQFYLFFPPLLMLLWGVCRKAIWPVLAALFIASFTVADFGSTRWPEAGFYLLHTRVWELMAGAMLAYAELQRLKAGKTRPESTWLTLLGLGLIGASYGILGQYTPHPSAYTLPAVVGVMLIIWFGSEKGFCGKILATKPSVGLGLISYSFYLWHVPILAFLSLYYLGETPPYPALWLGGMLMLSWLSWRYIEQPCRNAKIVPIKPLLLVSAVLWLGVLGVGYHFVKTNGMPERLTYSEELRASFARTAFMYGADKCINANTEGDMPPLCRIGKGKPKPDFLLLGDSHAFAFIPGFDEAAKRFGLAGGAATHSGCPSLVGNVAVIRRPAADRHCPKLNQQVVNYVLAHKPKAVFMAARWQYYVDGRAFLINLATMSYGKNPKERYAFLVEELRQTIAFYNEQGIQVYVLGQIPEQQHIPRRTYAGLHLPLAPAFDGHQVALYLLNMSADRKAYEEMTQGFNTLFKQWATEGKITYLNPADYFCNAEKCPVGTAQQSYYYDEDHLSIVGAKKLLPPMLENAMKDLAAE